MSAQSSPAGIEKLRESAPIDRQNQFFLRCLSEEGKVLEGQFTAKRLSIREAGLVNVRRVQLNGGFYYDENTPGRGIDQQTDWIHQMMAHLEYALIQKPMWFNLNELMELDILCEVYKKVMDFETTFRDRQRGAAPAVGSGQSGSLGTGEQPGTAGSVAAVVGGQVRSSLEP